MKTRKRIVIPALIVLLALVAFFVIRAINAGQAANSMWQTTTLERGELTAIVGATGTVRSNQSAVLVWQTSGKVEKANVEVGQRIPAGYTLAELDRASLPQAVILARADLVTARRALETLNTSESANAKAYQTLVQAQKALDDAKEKRLSKDFARSDNATLDQARANFILADENLKRAEDTFSFVADLPEDDARRAQGLLALAAARKNRDTALANLNYLLGKPDEQEISEADARVDVARAALEDAQREWERIKSGVDPDDLAAAEARVQALEATVNLYKLETPIAGTVTIANLKPGDQVSPGMTSFRVDDFSRLLVDVQIPEVDINQVQVGFPTRITFDAIQGKDYQGRVMEVAHVGTVVNGVVNFLVTIEMLDSDSDVKPGMTSAVNIITNQLENALIVPNRAVRFVNGKRVVYVLKGNVPTPVDVKIGATSDTVSELVGTELKEGDIIVLNPVVQPQIGGGMQHPERGDN
ncbi:MAG: efflux RND transporter periplasmic adaptor subunit [Anaerolineaceae bacterium]|nr:efflux RND transporter periplasmic adaptor subunit [Anaerolineaceae bacterium]